MGLRDLLSATAFTFVGPCLCLCLHAACAQQPSSEPAPIPESHPLQGTWESDGDSDTVSVTIAGNSLYFYRRPDFQYDTTFTLVPDSDPLELRATILDSPRTTDSAGDVVIAIYELEEGTLHLAAVDKVEGEPASFAETISDYRLERVQAGE
jgi:uncharacterized protein (TIGR03067 family)